MIPPSAYRRLLSLLPSSLQQALRDFRTRNRFLLFLAMGAVNTCVGYLLFIAALWTGLHYTLATLLSMTLGILFNFSTSGFIVFGSSTASRLPRFFASYGLVYLANCLGLFLLGLAGFAPSLAAAILLLPNAALAYLLQRHFVFAPPPAAAAPRKEARDEPRHP